MLASYPFQSTLFRMSASVILVVLFSIEADAIPAFARKYGTSCMTCHTAFPKLNAFGESFRRLGYRMPTSGFDVTQAPVLMGAPAWKRIWPNAIWPSEISSNAPVAFVVPFSANMTQDGSANGLDFAFPEGLQMVFGGTFDESVSFYGDVELVDGREFGGIGRLFIRFNLKDSLINFRFGQFDIAAVPFSGHRSLFLSDSIFNSFNAQPRTRNEETEHHDEAETEHQDEAETEHQDEPDHGEDHGNNILTSGHHSAAGLGASQMGFEIDGFREQVLLKNGGFGYALGMVNGNGIGGGDEGFDNNASKDFYGRAFYKIGGIGVLGTTGSEIETVTGNYFDLSPSIEFGVFSTYGKNPVEFGNDTLQDRSRRLGFDASFKASFLEVNGAYMKGRNQYSGHGVEPVTEYVSRYLEVNAITLPWIIPGFRYDQVRVSGLEPVERFTPNATLLLRANVKFVFTHQWVKGIEDVDSTKLSLVMAF